MERVHTRLQVTGVSVVRPPSLRNNDRIDNKQAAKSRMQNCIPHDKDTTYRVRSKSRSIIACMRSRVVTFLPPRFLVPSFSVLVLFGQDRYLVVVVVVAAAMTRHLAKRILPSTS